MSDRSEVQVANSNGEYPIEPKVAAARIAAFVVSLLMAFLLKTVPALMGLEDFLRNWAVQLLTDVLLAGFVFVATWWAGWRAKHVQRPQVGGGPVIPTHYE